MKLRAWFFQITKTGTKRGTRFKTGDRPTEQTFKELIDSSVFKTETNDRAKENDGSNVELLAGHTTLSTNTEAKEYQDPRTDRAISVQPHQIPQVKTQTSVVSSSYGNYEGETVEAALEIETDDANKRNIYILKIKDTFVNYITSIFDIIKQAVDKNAADIVTLFSDILSLNNQIQNIQTALDEVDSGTLDITEITPIGSVLNYSGATDPSPKWMICDGRTLDRTTYANLFTAIGGTNSPYGLPTGTTFNIPDLRDRSVKGVGTNYALGATGGADTVLLSAMNIPYHTHSFASSLGASISVSSSGNHKHSLWTWRRDKEEDNYSNGGFSLADDAHGKNSVKSWPAPETGEEGDHNHTITGNTGRQGDYTQESINVVGSYLALNFIIKVS